MILLPLIFPLLFPGVNSFTADFTSSGNPEELARLIVNSMSDEQALAQTFMFGWTGAGPSPLILDWIRERNIGGVKVFGWNTEDTTRLAETIGTLQTESLKGAFRIPLLVATDQEGGWIRHVKGATSETPGNMAIGASGVPMDAYWSGYYIGRELAVLGINMNFAPTVDLYTNRGSTLIGPRTFGVDPVKTGILGAAFVKGQQAAGLITTAKHYPGHGDTDLDSHGVLPQIKADFDVLWERELLPYRFLVKEGIPAIMSGHLAFPNTQAGAIPASLSPWFLQDILRKRIGFKGLIITDDLMMNGATSTTGSLSKTAKQALLAGNDIVMLSGTPNLNDGIWTNLLASMKEEPGFRSRVRDAAQRVLRVKLQYIRGGTISIIPNLQRVKDSLPDPEGRDFFLNLAARSVTLVKGDFPLYPETAGKVLLAGQYEDFLKIGKLAYPDAVTYRFSPGRGTAELQRYARDADTIIFCLSDRAGLKMLESLQTLQKRVIAFSVLSPVYLDGLDWVDGSIAVYSYSPESFISGFSAILGRLDASGKVPFPLNEPHWVSPQSSRQNQSVNRNSGQGTAGE
ncbi:MAG: glycoside hydrolase family 3 protein [Treponema sp.]|nr:glycoside hydrolase family 3 protein [Treponema sp.]